MRYWLFLTFTILLAGCYEPKEGCLDIEATNYDVRADDPCPDCCQYPKLLFQMQHYVTLATQPDTSFLMRYATKYPSPLDTNHFFYLDRGRFFASDLRLVRADGQEVTVSDSIKLPLRNGDSLVFSNNFAKFDRDILKEATIGALRTEGSFVGAKFMLGLSDLAQQVWVDTLKAGSHTLAVKEDYLSYDTLTHAIMPVHLVIRPDTLPDTQPLDFVFTEPLEISLDLAQPVTIERGFDIKLTVRIDWMELFREVDFGQDSPTAMREKIASQLAKVFSVTALKLE